MARLVRRTVNASRIHKATGGLLDANLQNLKFCETKIEKIHSPHWIMPGLVQVCVAVSTPQLSHNT
jgi:hypothetical protein